MELFGEDRFASMRAKGTSTSDATATAGDILEGKTAYISGGKVTGTLVPSGGEITDFLPLPVEGISALSERFKRGYVDLFFEHPPTADEIDIYVKKGYELPSSLLDYDQKFSFSVPEEEGEEEKEVFLEPNSDDTYNKAYTFLAISKNDAGNQTALTGANHFTLEPYYAHNIAVDIEYPQAPSGTSTGDYAIACHGKHCFVSWSALGTFYINTETAEVTKASDTFYSDFGRQPQVLTDRYWICWASGNYYVVLDTEAKTVTTLTKEDNSGFATTNNASLLSDGYEFWNDGHYIYKAGWEHVKESTVIPLNGNGSGVTDGSSKVLKTQRHGIVAPCKNSNGLRIVKFSTTSSDFGDPDYCKYRDSDNLWQTSQYIVVNQVVASPNSVTLMDIWENDDGDLYILVDYGNSNCRVFRNHGGYWWETDIYQQTIDIGATTSGSKLNFYSTKKMLQGYLGMGKNLFFGSMNKLYRIEGDNLTQVFENYSGSAERGNLCNGIKKANFSIYGGTGYRVPGTFELLHFANGDYACIDMLNWAYANKYTIASANTSSQTGYYSYRKAGTGDRETHEDEKISAVTIYVPNVFKHNGNWYSINSSVLGGNSLTEDRGYLFKLNMATGAWEKQNEVAFGLNTQASTLGQVNVEGNLLTACNTSGNANNVLVYDLSTNNYLYLTGMTSTLGIVGLGGFAIYSKGNGEYTLIPYITNANYGSRSTSRHWYCINIHSTASGITYDIDTEIHGGFMIGDLIFYCHDQFTVCDIRKRQIDTVPARGNYTRYWGFQSEKPNHMNNILMDGFKLLSSYDSNGPRTTFTFCK